MVNKEILIKNPTGLHLQAAGLLCDEATKYDSNIIIKNNNVEANAKSVLSVLGACIKMGDTIIVECSGSDEEEALNRIANILEVELLEKF